MQTLRVRTATILLGTVVTLFPLSGCSKTTTKTANPASTAAKPTASTDTAAPSDPPAATDPASGEVASTQPAAPKSAAPDTAIPNTDVPVAALGSDGVAGLAKDVSGAADPMAASLKTLGISDPKEVKCITDQTKAGLDQTKMMKAMFKCSPNVLSKQAAKSIISANPEISQEKATCVAKATFQVILDLPDEKMAAAIQSAKLPTELLGDVTAAAKSCGLTDAELSKVLKG